MDLSSLTGLFVGLHVALAEITKTPELSLSMKEGEDITRATQNVLRHYSVETTQKTIDIAALVGTLAQVYGFRWGAYMLRTRSPRREPQRRTSPIVDVTPQPKANGAAHPQEQPFDNTAAVMPEPEFMEE